MRTASILSALAVVLFLSASATAGPVVPFGDGGAGLQGVLDSITTDPWRDSSVDVLVDGVSDAYDSYWSIHATGGSVNTIVIEIAALADTNIFGLYDAADPSKKVQVFAGSDGQGTQKTVSILADGSVLVNYVDTGIDLAGNLFGYYLYNPTSGYGGPAYFYSDSNLNTDNEDHMAAYQGKGDTVQIPGYYSGTWSADEYILAWEDWRPYWYDPQNGYGRSDRDFTDFVVMVESVSPIPEPTTVLLLGCAVASLGLLAQRRRQRER